MSAALQNDALKTPHLDGLRIVAAAAIVVLHYAEYTKDHPVAHFIFEHGQHLNLLVDLFFVISGYVIASQYIGKVCDWTSILRFLWRRLARIYPLHLATLMFYLLIAAAAGSGLARSDNPMRYPLSDVPAQLLLLHAFVGQRLTFNFPSWSLSAEMFCYVLFPLLATLLIRKLLLIVVILAAVLLGNSVFAVTTDTGPWTDWINRGGVFRALPSFILGCALFKYRDRISQPGITLPLMPVLLLFLLFGFALPQTILLALVYSIAVLALRLDLAQCHSTFAKLKFDRWSHLTYSVYMLHIPVATVMLTVLARAVPGGVPVEKLFFVPLALVVLAVVSHLSCRFFETPVRYALYAVFDRKRAVPGTRGIILPRGKAK